MPRTVTILLGFLAVAVSIGWNVVHYPVVWEMVGSAGASASATPTATTTSRTAQQSFAQQQPASPTPPPIRPTEVKPAPEVGDQVKIDRAASATPKPTAVDVAATKKEGRPTTGADASKSLVPVAPADTFDMRDGNAAGGVGIRRLPPVDAAGAGVPTQWQGMPGNGAIPVYPSTGIE
jgi:hypothetical protein